jgi:hypothetical protein
MSGNDTGFATAAAMAFWAVAELAKNGAMQASRMMVAMERKAFNGLFQVDDRGDPILSLLNDHIFFGRGVLNILRHYMAAILDARHGNAMQGIAKIPRSF